MFFKGRAKEEDKEYYCPIGTHIEKLKQEKENLEEYHRQLSFIYDMLYYVVSKFSVDKRKNLKIILDESKYNWINSSFIEAMNILFRDSLSANNSFSREEILDYIKKLEAEMTLVNGYLNNVVQELEKYKGGR